MVNVESLDLPFTIHHLPFLVGTFLKTEWLL